MASISARIATRASAFGFRAGALFGLRLAIAGLALYFLFRTIELHDLAVLVQTARAGWIAAAAGLWFVNLGLQTAKWRLLLCHLDREVSYRRAAYSLFGTFPLGLITPGRLGEVARALLLPEYDWRRVSWLALLDRAATLAAILIFGLPGLFLLPIHWPAVFTAAPFWAAVSGAVALLALGAFTVRRRPGRPEWLRRLPAEVAILSMPAKMPGVFILSLLFVLTFAAQHVFLIRALAPLELAPGLSAAGAAHVVKAALPIALGDLGVREGAAVYFFGGIGVEPAAAAGGSLLLFFLNVVLPAALGLPLLLAARNRQKATTAKRTVAAVPVPN